MVFGYFNEGNEIFRNITRNVQYLEITKNGFYLEYLDEKGELNSKNVESNFDAVKNIHRYSVLEDGVVTDQKKVTVVELIAMSKPLDPFFKPTLRERVEKLESLIKG